MKHRCTSVPQIITSIYYPPSRNYIMRESTVSIHFMIPYVIEIAFKIPLAGTLLRE
jgi:hypothetical protein